MNQIKVAIVQTCSIFVIHQLIKYAKIYFLITENENLLKLTAISDRLLIKAFNENINKHVCKTLGERREKKTLKRFESFRFLNKRRKL